MKGDTLVLMLNGVEREYATLRRSDADSSAISNGTVYLLHGQRGQGLQNVRLSCIISYLIWLGAWLNNCKTHFRLKLVI